MCFHANCRENSGNTAVVRALCQPDLYLEKVPPESLAKRGLRKGSGPDIALIKNGLARTIERGLAGHGQNQTLAACLPRWGMTGRTAHGMSVIPEPQRGKPLIWPGLPAEVKPLILEPAARRLPARDAAKLVDAIAPFAPSLANQ